jgi:hypothetical protein
MMMKKHGLNIGTTSSWLTLPLKYLLQICHHAWENKGISIDLITVELN